jgi:hypothetical protein
MDRHTPQGWTLATIAGALMAAACLVGAQEATEPVDTGPEKPTRAELRNKQLDVSLEARDIERVLGKLKRASDLAKQRITEAAQVTEAASGAIDRGDSSEARVKAQQAADMFQEIARQLAALLAEETPQRIAAARNLAAQLSQAERQFLRQFPGVLNPQQSSGRGKIDPRSSIRPQMAPNQQNRATGQANASQGKSGGPQNKVLDQATGESDAANPPGGGSRKNSERNPGDSEKKQNGTGTDDSDRKSEVSGEGAMKQQSGKPEGQGGGEKKDEAAQPDGMSEEELREALARRAEQLAESGKTLGDVLKSISQSTDPADADAIRMLEAVLQETNLTQAIANMRQAAGTIRSGSFDDAQVAGLDLADRLEIASQRLGSIYRQVVAPRAEELRDIELALAELKERLERLETPAQVAAWHRDIRQLLSKLEELDVGNEARDQLISEIEKLGTLNRLPGGSIAWEVIDGLYVAPLSYTKSLVQLQDDIQARLQNLLLGDLDASPDQPTPPKYRELVERYYQVLSRDTGRREERATNAAPKK